MPDPQLYVYPNGIVQETETVVNVYIEYPTQEDFYNDFDHPTHDTIQNIENNYTVNNEFNVNVYTGDQQAPSLGQLVFQKLLLPPTIAAGATALVAATDYATGGLISEGANAIISGASSIFESTGALVLEGSAASAEYGLGFVLGVGLDSAVCSLAALCGYKIGNEIVDSTGGVDLWSDLLLEADPWSLKTPGSFMGKILGIQYGNKTYLDSRMVNYFKSKFKDWFGVDYDYYYNYNGYTVGMNELTESGSNTIQTNAVLVENAIGSHSGDPYTLVVTLNANVTITSQSEVFYTICECDNSVSNHQGYSNEYSKNYLFYSENQFSVTLGAVHGSLGAYGRVQFDQQNFGRITTDCGNFYCIGVYYTIFGVGYGSPADILLWPISPDRILIDDLITASNLALCNATPSELPNGVEVWPGDKISNPANGAINVVVDVTTQTTVPFYPVAFPNGPSVFPSYDPTNQPNPTTVYTPTTQIIPYVIPWPQQNPESDPEDDPSNPSPIVTPIILPTPAPGTNDGETPPITAPIIAPPFDLSYQYGGLYNVFNPTAQQLYDFGRFLWVSWTDATLTKIINNPFDGVISLHEIYATPNNGASKNITTGFLDSQVSAPTVPDRYSSLDCGTIVVPEYFNNYLDYAPYTSAFAFLPFIGIVELNADDIVGHAVNITYKIDSYSGACIAIITVARSNGNDENYSASVYQFEGNCAVQLPITGGSQSSLTAGLWESGSQTIGQGLLNIVSGGGISAQGILQSLLDTIGGISTQLLTKKSEVHHSGTMSGNFGAMAGKTPYIIVKRPRQVSVVNYNLDYGFPAHKMVTIGQCQGYVRVREVNVISATATDAEKAKIEELLKGGVYVT